MKTTGSVKQVLITVGLDDKVKRKRVYNAPAICSPRKKMLSQLLTDAGIKDAEYIRLV